MKRCGRYWQVLNLFCWSLGLSVWSPLAVSVSAQDPQSQSSASAGTLGSTMTHEELQNRGKAKSAVEEGPKARLITAAPEPRPALRYRFWPAEQELKSGDAKVYFFRTAIYFRSASREKQLSDSFEKWEGVREAGTDLPIQEIRTVLEPYLLIFDELEAMSLCDHQDLDMQLRNLRGANVYSVLLEEVQVARNIAKLLRWRMVEQAAAGNWDGFTRTARTAYRLAGLIATGDSLIHHLVGIAITNMITDEVQRAAQYHGSPNFYWALASLPRPMFNLRPALELETSIVDRVFPSLAECRTGPLSENAVQEKWEAMQKVWKDIDPDFSASARIVGALSVEKAKANLLQRGWKEESFKNYPVMQLVLLDLDDTLREKGEDAMKYLLLPSEVALENRIQENAAFEGWIAEEKSLASLVAGLLFPAIEQVSNAVTRTEYIINGAMNKEAIRMHIAKHGELPKDLSSLEPVPALLNPYTNKPYEMVVKPSSAQNLVEVTVKGDVRDAPVVYVTWISPFLIEVKTQN